MLTDPGWNNGGGRRLAAPGGSDIRATVASLHRVLIHCCAHTRHMACFRYKILPWRTVTCSSGLDSCQIHRSNVTVLTGNRTGICLVSSHHTSIIISQMVSPIVLLPFGVRLCIGRGVVHSSVHDMYTHLRLADRQPRCKDEPKRSDYVVASCISRKHPTVWVVVNETQHGSSRGHRTGKPDRCYFRRAWRRRRMNIAPRIQAISAGGYMVPQLQIQLDNNNAALRALAAFHH